MAGEYKPVTHVIFDLDGLILNSEPAAKQILDEILERYQKGPMPLSLQAQILGRSEKDELNMLIAEMRLPLRFPAFKKYVNELEEKRYKKALPLFPGVQRLVCHLHKNKIPMAIATSLRREMIELKCSHYKGLFANFDHVVSGSSDEEIQKSKPDPFIFKYCASKFEDPPAPEKCLVFEDSPAGVAAACCAGMQVVMIPDPLMDPTYIRDATLVLKYIADFKPEQFGLPAIPH